MRRGCRWRWPSSPPGPPTDPRFRWPRSPPSSASATAALDAFAERRPGHRRAGRVLLVLPHAARRRRRGCSGCSACTPARTSRRARRGQPRRRAAAAGRRALLAELTRAHLVTEHGARPVHLPRPAPRLRRRTGPRRRHRADRTAAAVHRMLDHYLHTAHAADQLLDPHRDPITRRPAARRRDAGGPRRPRGGAGLVHRRAPGAAGRRPARRRAPGSTRTPGSSPGRSTDVPRPARALAATRRTIQRIALAAAQPARRPGRAGATRTAGLARAYIRLGRLRRGARALPPGPATCTASSATRTGQAHTHLGSGDRVRAAGPRRRRARPRPARRCDLYRAAGHRAGQADALNAVGWYHAQLGDHEPALAYCQQALALHAGDSATATARPHTWDSLGYAHHHLGRPCDGAVALLPARASTSAATSATATTRPATLIRLGDTHRRRRATTTRPATRGSGALDILDDLGHPDADQVRAKLRSSHGPVPDQSAPRSCRVETPGASSEATQGERNGPQGQPDPPQHRVPRHRYDDRGDLRGARRRGAGGARGR